jgi:TRAP-type uncharacterized transport system fused permease subunit
LITIPVSWIRKKDRMGFREIIDALADGATNTIIMVCTCATVGFIVGTFLLTGLGLTLSSAVISISGANFWVTAFLIFLVCLILGMGMTTPAVYIMVSVIGVPILLKMGVPILPAHLFVFFSGTLSHITPPVCIGAFAAAQLAGANIWDTGFTAMRIGFVAYLLPFLVLLHPAITLSGTPIDILIAISATLLSTLLLVCAVQGWALYRESYFERLLALVAGVGLLLPGNVPRIMGTLLAPAILLLHIYRNRRPRS